ncbi:MAG: hypothetical protein R3335_12275 [Anaerolineales bacterium]|nr:hypothetical protein [Anaerolineales bacterium]
MPENLEIRTAVQIIVILLALAAVVNLWRGISSIRSARGIRFYRVRHDRMVRGWRLLIISLGLLLVTFLFNSYAEPVAFSYFPPSPSATIPPSITLTPSVTLSPTITLTPTITETPSETETPTITPTPSVPDAIEALFEGQVTSLPNAVFSPLTFTRDIDENYQPIDPATEFELPLGHMYSLFSYDGMVDGVQWTALWYRDGRLVHFETKPWDGGTGGLGYTDWLPDPSEWEPGNYEIQIFIGLDWVVVGRFIVLGDVVVEPTAADASSPTQPPPALPTSSGPSTPTVTPIPPTPTLTRQPTATPVTPTVTITRWPTATETSP